VARDEEVAGFEISVDDALRVRFGQGLAGLDDPHAGFVDGQRAPIAEPAFEVLAVEQLHRDVGKPAAR
jgi:hypothetical protein